MQSDATTVDQYLSELPSDRQAPMILLREAILENLPEGFAEEMSCGMIGYVVPHQLYPDGYHCDPNLPLPFTNLASHKHFIALYHMGIYAKPEIHNWFIAEYPKHCSNKLDIGKSCIRFKNMNKIPYELIAELMQKLSVDDWISTYQKVVLPQYKKAASRRSRL